MGFVKMADAVAQTGDGTFGFWDGTYNHLVGGWSVLASPQTFKTHWRSDNDGVTFSALPDFDYRFHTAATCVVNNVAYIVGGDTLSPTYDGDWRRSSHKYENGAWSQIAANPGIANRCLCQLVYLNDEFFLIGGQSSITTGIVYYDTVLRSTDGLNTFTEVVSDTKTFGMQTNLAWGAYATHRGKIWRVCGRQHSSLGTDTAIFSSVDGINWDYRGRFRGTGRNYLRLLSHNGRLFVFNGHNARTNEYLPSGNISDYWIIDELNGGRLVQTYMGSTGWSARHAPCIWSSPKGIFCFSGSVSVNDLWLLEA